MVFLGQFAVCSRSIDGIVPIGAARRLNLYTFNQTELSIVSDDIEWIWTRLSIPSRSGNDGVDSERITVVLFNGDTWSLIVETDHIVDGATKNEIKVLLTLTKLVCFNNVER